MNLSKGKYRIEKNGTPVARIEITGESVETELPDSCVTAAVNDFSESLDTSVLNDNEKQILGITS